MVQPTYNTKLSLFPTYPLSVLYCKDIHLRHGKVIQNKTFLIIQEQDKEDKLPKSILLSSDHEQPP